MPIIDESKPNGLYAINWDYPINIRNKSLKLDPAMIEKILQNISKQTSLTFTKERRPVDVWVITKE